MESEVSLIQENIRQDQETLYPQNLKMFIKNFNRRYEEDLDKQV